MVVIDFVKAMLGHASAEVRSLIKAPGRRQGVMNSRSFHIPCVFPFEGTLANFVHYTCVILHKLVKWFAISTENGKKGSINEIVKLCTAYIMLHVT